MPTLIRDLIDLPEQVHRGDFVLRLTEGIQRPEETLRDYVVTPQLVSCFDEALKFIRGAVTSGSSKGAYLHGSFGSGKSHFMAVLHLLLRNHPGARGIPQLAPVVARHSEWMEGRRFLLVPYHMIGARSMESAILGHYVSYVSALHPDATMPGVFKAESLFADAEALRIQIGDVTFFDRLNARATSASAGWGNVAGTWDATAFDEARRQPPGSELRGRLVGDLVQTYFSSYADVVRGLEESYVPLDAGLSVISSHARDLGYDAVILFLDELILWLASHAGDPGFVTREGQKLAQLVEAQEALRPIPIVSFVARQRDLRELVGTQGTGAQDLAFADVLRWWEARFHTITLEDRNLPAIAERRVLRPRSEAARIQLNEAFQKSTTVRKEVLDTLLTSTADREMFRQVYPFSPALVQALVAVSSVLQRERTALKVMLQLLVDQRDTLALGDLVPVGDLFDVIAEGDEAFSEAMRSQFENAHRLYARKLLPMLYQDHGLTAESLAALPPDDARRLRFRADDRLVKTLLLAALTPEVEAFKALTPARLAALNHGTIRTPIPGAEAAEVLRRVRKWASQVGEIKISGEEGGSTISVQITGVDTDSIIEQARREDNHGNRKRLIKEVLFRQFGIEDWDGLFIVHKFAWRGSDRQSEVIYGNVWEMPDESLRGPADEWRVVIDYPFDEKGHSPNDDVARVDRFRENQDARTVVWIPSFFSGETQRELGALAVLEHILTGERFDTYATHLPAVERATARQLLGNQRDQLRQRMVIALEAAYGLQPAPAGMLDTSHDLADHFQSLEPRLKLQPPVAANLRAGLHHLLDQALASQFPGHPEFTVPLKLSNLRKVLPVLLEGAQTPDGRVPVDRSLRDLVRAIAEPLELGRMGETHLVLGTTWATHFTKMRAQHDGLLRVRDLRRWMEEPRPRGLPEALQNLVILVWAEQQRMAFHLHGGPTTPSLESMRDDIDLQAQKLPPADVWRTARSVAQEVFGIASSELLNASNVSRLAADVRSKAQEHRDAARTLAARLPDAMKGFEVNVAQARRLRTARAVEVLLERVMSAEPESVLATVADSTLDTSAPAMGLSATRAAALVASLESTAWDIFEAVRQPTGVNAEASRAVRARVAEALEADELAVNLTTALKEAQSAAVRLLSAAPAAHEPPPPPSTKGWRRVSGRDRVPAEQAVAELTEYVKGVDARRRTRMAVSWQVEEQE
ncbi:MAG: phage resistance protein [Vicinamibacterales bacterium]